MLLADFVCNDAANLMLAQIFGERIFTDADDYSMEIELPLADCPQNLDIFGMITRKDVDTGDIFFDAVLQDTNFINSASRRLCQVYLSNAFSNKV